MMERLRRFRVSHSHQQTEQHGVLHTPQQRKDLSELTASMGDSFMRFREQLLSHIDDEDEATVGTIKRMALRDQAVLFQEALNILPDQDQLELLTFVLRHVGGNRHRTAFLHTLAETFDHPTYLRFTTYFKDHIPKHYKHAAKH